MFNFIFNQAPSIDWATITISIISAFIAGGFSWLATQQAHKHNRKLKKDELYLYEKATALSIIEELDVLKNEFQNEFNNLYKKLKKDKFINVVYYISQDYTTIFNQNAGEIGLIKNTKLRNLIIKSYILLKRYIENLKLYKSMYYELYQKRNIFIEKVFPQYVLENCSDLDTDNIIKNIRAEYEKDKCESLISNEITPNHIKSFLISDESKVGDLCAYSLQLKNEYKKLKQTINNTIYKCHEIYKEK